MNLLSPAKYEVCPEPPQPGQGVVGEVDCSFMLVGPVKAEYGFLAARITPRTWEAQSLMATEFLSDAVKFA